MNPKKRQDGIISLLRAMQRELSVEEIASSYRTSHLTIRRDLDALAEKGAVIRTHGGCILSAGFVTSYQKRVGQNFNLKRAIGREAAQLVSSGEVILIDDGSTTFHLASNLDTRGPLTVVTNSIAIIPELARYPHIQLEILGGLYNRDTNFLGGSLTERLLEQLYFDAVFVGADAVNEDGLCFVRTPELARLTQVMLKRATRCFLLADHTKTGGHSYVKYGTLDDFDLWITTEGIDPELRAKYEKMTTIKAVDWSNQQEGAKRPKIP